MNNEQKSKVHECTLSDEQLKNKLEEWATSLSKTGGRSWSLRVPVDFNNDPDMLMIESGNRIRQMQYRITELEAEKARLTDINQKLLKNMEAFSKCQYKDEETGEEYSGSDLAYAIRFAANAYLREAEQVLKQK